MPYCDSGHEADSVKTAIVDNKFGNYCPAHIAGTWRKPGSSAAIFDRARDVEEHRKDMLQPLDSKGHPNGEFIRAYPEEAAELFNDETLKNHDR